LGLFGVRLGICPFGTSPRQHYRRDEAEFWGEERKRIYAPRLHTAMKKPGPRTQTPKENWLVRTMPFFWSGPARIR